MSIYRTTNPMEFDDVDGIVISETAPPSRVRGVGTGVAIMVGRFNKGPIAQLTEVTSREDIVNRFGDGSQGYNALVNKRFSRLRIIRVKETPAVAAAHTFMHSGSPAAIFTAKTAGVGGNSITVLIETGTDNGKKYTIVEGRGTPEVFDNVEQDDLESTLNSAGTGSALVTVEAVGDTAPSNIAATPLSGGVDEVAPTDTDYSDAIDVAAAQSAGNILFLDRYTDARNLKLKAHAAETEDKMVICGGDEDQTVEEAIAAVAQLRDTQGRIIFAYNWLQTLIKGVPTYVSPASFLASIISRTSAHIDPAFSGNSEFLYGVSGIRSPLTRADYIRLVNAGIAAFEFDSDIGFKLKSGVVTQIADTSKVTILRRRMADYLTNSIGTFLKVYQNAPNSLANREACKAAILNFIQLDEEQGILPRDSEVQGGTAKVVDIDTPNTDESIAAGSFFINYRQRIFSSMRYIVLLAEIGQSVVVTEGE